MEVGGIEPPSENLSAKLSPIKVGYKNSLRPKSTNALRVTVASWVLFTPQSLGAKVPRLSAPDPLAAGEQGPAAA